MQRFSFDFGDPVFRVGDLDLSLQIITFENVYGLDPSRTHVTTTPDGWRIVADGLTWAGGQEHSPGGASITVGRLGDGSGADVVVEAHHTSTIRCTKLLVRRLPSSTLLARRWEEEPIPSDGVVYQYPGYLRVRDTTVAAPLVFLRPRDGGAYIAFRSLDDQVRCKRFAFEEADWSTTVELIHEEAATCMGNRVTVPGWRIQRTSDPAALVRAHAVDTAQTFGFRRWEERSDVPAWARQVAFVAALHGMHWSGYVFNTYERMLAVLTWITRRIEGRHVLAYLPGWEGRYYWQYGDFRPDLRLGGTDGFRRLVDGAHALGVRLMPMYAANSANAGLPNFEQWGVPARMRTAGGYVDQGNKPDWDGSRSHDPTWQAILNPGAPTWRARLERQVGELLEMYGLGDDAVFFDTTHWWQNDPNHAVFDGLVALRDQLKSRFPNLLFTGEGWYDALGAVTPVSHSEAHLPVRWADEIFGPYNRYFDHLATGDASRGSTGVHERGTQAFEVRPLARHRWPTATIVDGTIERAPEQVERLIAQGREYAERFLSTPLANNARSL